MGYGFISYYRDTEFLQCLGSNQLGGTNLFVDIWDELIESLEAEIPNVPLERICQNHLSTIFTLRLKSLAYLAEQNSKDSDVLISMAAEDVSPYQTSIQSEIGGLLSDSLGILSQITANSFSMIKWSQLLQDSKDIPSYQDFKTSLMMFPNPNSNLTLRFVEASLSTEFYIILALLLKDGELKFVEKSVERETLFKDLQFHLRESLIACLAYAELSGFGTPIPQDIPQYLEHPIEIFKAVLDFEFGHTQITNMTGMQSILKIDQSA